MPEQESYSREAYDEAEREIEEAKGEIAPEKSTEELKRVVEKRGAAEERRDRLGEVSWDEALQAHEEYKGLLARQDKAQEAVNQWKKEHHTGPEPTEAKEPQRTPETEAQAIVEFYQGIGIEVDPADVRAKIEAKRADAEKEGLEAFTYLPKDIKISKLLKIAKADYPVWVWEGIGDPDTIKMPRTTQESYAVAHHYTQEPDEDSLGDKARSGLDWEKTDNSYMGPLERLAFGMRWHKENGTQLDEKYVTLCPGSRAAGGRVPCLSFSGGRVRLSSDHPGGRGPGWGVRRVV